MEYCWAVNKVPDPPTGMLFSVHFSAKINFKYLKNSKKPAIDNIHLQTFPKIIFPSEVPPLGYL